MAAGRHNLSRRAVLGACFGVPALLRPPARPTRGQSLAIVPIPHARWARALAAFDRAEARLAALPAAASDDLFGDHECTRLAALARLLRAPAPDLAALALKIELAIDEQAWENEGAESCLATLKADAWRLAHED